MLHGSSPQLNNNLRPPRDFLTAVDSSTEDVLRIRRSDETYSKPVLLFDRNLSVIGELSTEALSLELQTHSEASTEEIDSEIPRHAMLMHCRISSICTFRTLRSCPARSVITLPKSKLRIYTVKFVDPR